MARLTDHIESNNTNRVAEAIFLFAEEENKLKISNPWESRQDGYNTRLKLDFYQGIEIEHRRTTNKLEKQSLIFVHHEIRKLKAKLNPTWFNRIYYSDFADIIKGWLRSKNDPVSYYQGAIKKLDDELTQNHNLQHLSSEIKKVGFNMEMEASLKRMINLNLPEFPLRYVDIENRNAHYLLHFKKIPQTDLYYFEKFDAISRPSLDSLLNKDVNCQRQTFYVHDNLKINAGEAERLVNGKAVYRRINGEDTWLMKDNLSMRDQLKFIEFDLEALLLQLPIKEREDHNKYHAISAALKNGKAKDVTLLVNETPQKFTLEVDPQNNTINILDKDCLLINPDQLLRNGNKAANVWKLVNEQTNQNQKRKRKVG